MKTKISQRPDLGIDCSWFGLVKQLWRCDMAWTIPLFSFDFPSHFRSMPAMFECDELDLCWSALTVGRPNIQSISLFGQQSIDEAYFRTAMLRANLDLQADSVYLSHSPAFDALDPTEKGWINYSLGMIFTKIVSARFLDAPWLMHFRWFSLRNGVMTQHGGSTPDFIAVDPLGRYHALEAKGRVGGFSNTILQDAKDQADQAILVNMQPVDLHIGAMLYRFDYKNLAFAWRDPPADSEKSPIELFETQAMWREYYRVPWALSQLTKAESIAFQNATGIQVSFAEDDAHYVKQLISDESSSWREARDHLVESAASEEGQMRRLMFNDIDDLRLQRAFADGVILKYDSRLRRLSIPRSE